MGMKDFEFQNNSCLRYSLNPSETMSYLGYIVVEIIHYIDNNTKATTLRGNAETSLVSLVNQEDSLVVSQGAVDRGLFNGCKFTYYKDELEQREEFGNPDAATTSDIKSGSYSKLNDGIIKVGTKVNKGDAIIGKYMRIPKTADQDLTMSDRSTIYKENEEAIVHNVIVDRNEEDERFCKVAMRKVRPVAIGDKFSVKGTSQVLTDKGWKEIQHLDIEKDKVATMREGGFLDYVHPSGLSTYEYDGDMYKLQSLQINICVTKNHKLYVKKRNKQQYELLRTPEVFGKEFRIKRDTINSLPYQEFFTARTEDGTPERYPMDYWLKLLGMFIADGFYCNTNNCVVICASKHRKKDFHREFLNGLNVAYRINATKTYITRGNHPALSYELEQLSLGARDKHLPEYVWNLSQDQSRILIDSLLQGDGTPNIGGNSGSARYFTISERLANDVSRLTLHAGWGGSVKVMHAAGRSATFIRDGISRDITANHDLLSISIIKTQNEPGVSHCSRSRNGFIEQYEHYEGTVYCLEIPDTHLHVYYSRENILSPSCWTGNSSRAGLSSFWPEWSIKDTYLEISASCLFKQQDTSIAGTA